MSDAPGESPTALAASLAEAAGYEAWLTQRRRGVVLLGWAAVFAGFAWLAASRTSGPSGSVAFLFGVPSLVVLVALFGLYRLKKTSWSPVFLPPVPAKERRRRQAFVLAASALVALLGPFALARETTVAADWEPAIAALSSFLLILLVIATTRSMGDLLMQKAAAAAFAVTVLLLVGVVPSEHAEAVTAVALCALLVAIGAYRVLSPRRVSA